MVVNTVALLAASVAPWWFRMTGIIYLLGATLLGVTFLIHGIRFALKPSEKHARTVFLYSMIYLVVLMTLLAIGG